MHVIGLTAGFAAGFHLTQKAKETRETTLSSTALLNTLSPLIEDPFLRHSLKTFLASLPLAGVIYPFFLVIQKGDLASFLKTLQEKEFKETLHLIQTETKLASDYFFEHIDTIGIGLMTQGGAYLPQATLPYIAFGLFLPIAYEALTSIEVRKVALYLHFPLSLLEKIEALFRKKPHIELISFEEISQEDWTLIFPKELFKDDEGWTLTF
jgi:hypothetical protein